MKKLIIIIWLMVCLLVTGGCFPSNTSQDHFSTGLLFSGEKKPFMEYGTVDNSGLSAINFNYCPMGKEDRLFVIGKLGIEVKRNSNIYITSLLGGGLIDNTTYGLYGCEINYIPKYSGWTLCSGYDNIRHLTGGFGYCWRY